MADHPWIQNAKKAPNVSLGETVRARLKQFSVMNKLKKRALRVLSHCLVFLVIYDSPLAKRKMNFGLLLKYLPSKEKRIGNEWKELGPHCFPPKKWG